MNSIFVTPGGKLLFATSNGLCQWQGNGFAAIRLPLQRQSIYSIVGYGNDIWLTSAAGIIKYQPGKGIQIFNTADGVAGGQFQINSGLLASDGSVFFGSTQGFNVFRPYNIRVNQVRPTVVISQIKLFNKVLSAASDKFRSNSHGTVQLRLSHSENMITLQYAALSYCTPGKNLYAYRMDGIDDAWNYVGNQHEATYSNLAPGTYTFRVKATNNDGVWSSKCAELYCRPSGGAGPPNCSTWCLLWRASGWCCAGGSALPNAGTSTNCTSCRNRTKEPPRTPDCASSP